MLATAHALGFGIYRNADPKTGTGLIQMFDRHDLWRDVGYAVASGELEDNRHVRLARTNQTSPRFLEDHSPLEDLIQYRSFPSKQEQANWLVAELKRNLEEDELGYDDVIVINPDPISTRREVALPRKKLFEAGINSHLAGVDTSPDVFFDADNQSVSFTGIHRAKGNEAGMVYIINAQDCYQSFGSLARVRNQLFTAITRSKAWVRILGVGPEMDALIREVEAVRAQNYELDFVYPGPELRKHLTIINRDMTENEKRSVQSASEQLKSITSDLATGRIRLDDLPHDELERLKTLILKGSNDVAS